MEPQIKATNANIERRLRTRLRLYGIIFLIMLVIVITDVVRGQIGIALAFLALAIGTVLGLALGRMYRLSWDEVGSQVIARIDWLGGVILVVYIVFAVFRNQLIAPWVASTALAAFSLSLVTGTMLGRVLSIAHGIRRLLGVWGFVGYDRTDPKR